MSKILWQRQELGALNAAVHHTKGKKKKDKTTKHILAIAIHSLVGHKVWIVTLRSKRFQLHLMHPDPKILYKKDKSPKCHKTI